jgi:hypothetical protein
MYLNDNAAVQERIAYQYFGGPILFPHIYWNYSVISFVLAVAIGIIGAILWSMRGKQKRAERPVAASSFAFIGATILYFVVISDFRYYL